MFFKTKMSTSPFPLHSECERAGREAGFTSRITSDSGVVDRQMSFRSEVSFYSYLYTDPGDAVGGGGAAEAPEQLGHPGPSTC